MGGEREGGRGAHELPAQQVGDEPAAERLPPAGGEVGRVALHGHVVDVALGRLQVGVELGGGGCAEGRGDLAVAGADVVVEEGLVRRPLRVAGRDVVGLVEQVGDLDVVVEALARGRDDGEAPALVRVQQAHHLLDLVRPGHR